jgi:rod shape-determining protein MreC
MDLVPKNLEVKKDQKIISSGLDSVLPKGLLIGKISKIESSESEIFQKIEVTPIVDIEKLERVFIILNF